MPRFLAAAALAAVVAAPSLAPAQVIDLGEATHMAFLREEEKLARDVYLTLASLYPRSSVFGNIADGSEQTHTDTVANLLASHGLPDPNPATNDLPGSIGVFTGTDFGWYFTEKFDLLVARGATSLLEALHVGAFIEELDMLDIVKCPKVIVEGGFGIAAGNYVAQVLTQAEVDAILGR